MSTVYNNKRTYNSRAIF